MSSAPVCNPVNCTSDADCPAGTSAAFPNGYCAEAHHLSGLCGCFTACREDADCGPGAICECGNYLGQCVPARCATNADCGAGFACIATAQGVTGGACNQTSNAQSPPITLFVCQTAGDGCRSKADCTDASAADAAATREIESPACLFDGSRRACGLFCAYPP
jgi:Cys-rich repeat protein